MQWYYMKCPRCKGHNTYRKINYKQFIKRFAILTILVIIFTILSILYLWPAIILVPLVIFGALWSCLIGKKDRTVTFKCRHCKKIFKVPNYNNRQVIKSIYGD